MPQKNYLIYPRYPDIIYNNTPDREVVTLYIYK